jgi:hypothetical protein
MEGFREDVETTFKKAEDKWTNLAGRIKELELKVPSVLSLPPSYLRSLMLGSSAFLASFCFRPEKLRKSPARNVFEAGQV